VSIFIVLYIVVWGVLICAVLFIGCAFCATVLLGGLPCVMAFAFCRRRVEYGGRLAWVYGRS
jgi:hypothetical protein